MRLIDADELKERILDEGKVVIDEDILECDNVHEIIVYLLEKVEVCVCEKIDQAPTVEARPVVRGEWEQRTEWDEDNNAIFECTNCRHGDVQAKGADVPYCWYCGADMRKKVE